MWRQRWDGNETCILEGPSTDDLKVSIVTPAIWPDDATWAIQAYVRSWAPGTNYENLVQFTSTDNSSPGILAIDLIMYLSDWVTLGINAAHRAEWVVQLLRTDVGSDGQTITIVHGPLVITEPTVPFATP